MPHVEPIGDLRWRRRVRVRGRVRDLRVRPTADGVASLECTLVDDTGGITIALLGRRHIGGVTLGREGYGSSGVPAMSQLCGTLHAHRFSEQSLKV
jgi:hypothetical protein